MAEGSLGAFRLRVHGFSLPILCGRAKMRLVYVSLCVQAKGKSVSQTGKVG